jgi:anaerobic magnesium-protoporphyrin IX monomethyl ester cyclase
VHILLAYTTPSSHHRQPGVFEQLLPIGLCSLHALLRSHAIPVTLANLTGMPKKKVIDLLLRSKPALAGLSQWTHNRHATIALAQLIKQTLPDCTILLGGGHATHQAELILQRHPEVDLIATGEAEQTLLELLDALQNNQPLHEIPGLVLRKNGVPQRTPSRAPLPELDVLPFPSSWLHEAIHTDVQLQAEFISSSRGCPAACRFCASPAFWGRRVRARSAASVADEIRFIRDQFGLIYLSLRDDTFTADRRRTVALCHELIERRTNIFWNCQSRVEAIDLETLDWMRRAGCECIQLGVESGSPDILKQLGKQTTPEQIVLAADLVRQAGMQLSVYLISGIPGETDTDKQQTIALIKRIKADDLQVAPLAYYPGTALFEAAVKNEQLKPDLFETCSDEAVLAQPDGQKQVDRLLALTSRYRQGCSIEGLLAVQKNRGYCAVTAMQTGDRYAAAGDFEQAEKQYRLMTRCEPDHPWGWFLLGELSEQTGKTDEATACYHNVLNLVPRHELSTQGLQRLKH